MTESSEAASSPSGIAFLCGADGSIESMIRVDPLLASGLVPGGNLVAVVDQASSSKAAQLLMDVRLQGVSYGCELVLPTDDGPKVCSFAGFRRGDAILVVGAPSSVQLEQLCNEVEGCDHALLKRQRRRLRPLETDDTYQVMDDLTRLNNELVGQTRSLQRQNLKLTAQVAALNDQLALLAEAVQEFGTVARLGRPFSTEESAGPERPETGAPDTVRTPLPASFLETYGQVLGDLCLFLKTEAAPGVTPMVKSRRSERFGALVAEAVAMNHAWWQTLSITLELIDHDPDAVVVVNGGTFRRALAILIASAMLTATPGTSGIVDAHCRDDVCTVQLTLVSGARAGSKFRFPRPIKRLMAENGFKVTVMRGSVDRLTIILKQTAAV